MNDNDKICKSLRALLYNSGTLLKVLVCAVDHSAFENLCNNALPELRILRNFRSSDIIQASILLQDVIKVSKSSLVRSIELDVEAVII